MPNIYKRKSDNNYYVRIPLGKDMNGKYQYDTLYAKKKSVLEEKIKEYEKNKGINGRRLDKIPFTLSEWTYKYLFNSIHANVSPVTFNGYMSIYNTHIKDSELGKMELKNIQPMHLEKYLSRLKSQGKHSKNEQLSADSVKKIMFLLKTSFQAAVKNNLLVYNPMSEVKPPKNTKEAKPRRALSISEQTAYIRCCDLVAYGFLYKLALFTGMRQSELMGLKWEYVDFTNNIIKINEILKYTTVYDENGKKHNTYVTKSPKSKKGYRDVPIPKSLLPMFKQLKLQSTSDYVFSTSTGNHLNQGNINRGHKTICKLANIELVPFHCLRHTYATRLLEAGENYKTLQKLLGHADIQTTLNIYTHVSSETMQSATDKLDTLLSSML